MSLSSTAGKKMHPCDFCDKLFSTTSNLREHRRTHTGEKPFVCKYCGKAFAQSSTHSKHQLVHKNKEMINGSREHVVQQIHGEQQEPRLTKLVESSMSEFRKESSLFPPETFSDKLKEHKLIMVKAEVESFHDNDWCNTNPVFDKRIDTSLHIESDNDDIQRSPADQNPIITGMFKNRACELTSLPEVKTTSMKQEFFNVEEIDVGSSSFLTEVDTAEDALTIQYDEAQNLEASALFIRETKTILCEESKEFTSVTSQLSPVYSKGIGQDDSRIWDNRPKETSIIQLDLTLDDDDDNNVITDVEEKFQNNTETFFKCIHCSETFSSLEEHVCLAKEAKMFFKCQVCQKTFTQYGPFVRHKKTHEDPKEFTVGSSSASKTMEYKTCGSTITIDLRKESSDISRMTDSFYLKEATQASCLVDLPTSSFQSESERIPSSTLRLKEEQNQNDVIIIEEDPGQLCSSSSGKDVPENRVIVGKTIEKSSTIFNLSNTDQVDHVQAGYIERSNRFVADRNKPQRRVLSSETTSKPEMETGNLFNQIKQQSTTKKTLKQIGKKVHPYTCLFCPRQFSTASNMREHMRTHTGEKPFSCQVCHKKFAQSSTRSKHMLIHKCYKLPDSLSYGKEILPRQTFEKQCDKTGNNQEKSFLLDRFANLKESPRINPTKTSPLKIPCTKSYSSLPNSKVCRQPLKRYAFKMPVESSSNFLIPSKIVSNKFFSLNAKPSWRNGINKNNNFGYQKEEYKNRMNALRTKEDNVLMPGNTQNIKTKTSFSPTVAPSGSTTSTFGLSFENPKTKIDRLPSATTPTTTIASMLPRPKSRCANRLLRNARTYRPFRCTYCPRTFSTSGNMKEHMRTHTGEKPFRCEYCHRRFAQSSTHSKHVLIHIRKQQLNCFFCGRFFSQVALLRDHIISDHKTTHENHSRNIQAVNRLPRHAIGDNKTREGLSLSSKVPSESFPESDNGLQSFREEKRKRNEIIAASKSNSEESNPVLTKKRFVEMDLSTNRVDYLIQEQYKSCRSFQENEKNDRKRDSAEIGKTVGKESQENVDSVIAKHSLVSKSNLSSNLTEGTSVTGQLESEMVGKMPATRTLQQQPLSQIKSSTLPAFEATSIKTKNFELSSVNKSGSRTYLANDGNLIVDMEALDNLSSVDDFSVRTSFALEGERSNNCVHSGKLKIDNEFQINYSYENKQFFNLSDDKETLNNCTDDNQQNSIKLAPGSPQNKNCDNNLEGVELQFKTTVDTDGQSEECGKSKVCGYERTKSYQLKVPSLFPNSNQSLMLSSSFPSDLISPIPANNTRVNCLSLKAEIDEINESGMDDLRSSNNASDDKYLIFSHVTDCEQSTSDIGSRTSFELARHQNEVFIDLNGDIPDRKAIGQNASALLNSEPSLNSCNGDFSKNFNWLLDVEPKPKSEREEPTSAFLERNDEKILGSKTDNSVQEESIVLLPNIKLETNIHHEFYSEQVESRTNSSLTQGTMIDDSYSSGSHLKISKIASNVPYPFTDDIDENERSTYHSKQFCDNIERFDTNLMSSEAVGSTKSRSSELISVYPDDEKQQLTLNGMLPNVIERISKTLLERKRKNLPRHLAAGKFKCNYCNRSFSSRSNMKEHTRIHTGEKPFECVFCSRRFAQSSTHSKHVQTHLRFKQLVCPQCGKRFLQANNLCQHIRAQHKNSSGNSAAKRVAPHSDPLSLMAQKSSGQMRQSSSNNEKSLVGDIKNNKPTISVPNISIELSDDLPNIKPSQLRTLKAENNPLINIDSEQTNKITNINIPLANNNYLNPHDIHFKTTQSNRSNLPLNKSQTGLSKSDSQFSSEHSILHSIQTLDTKINLQKSSNDTFDEQSSDYHIYNKETVSELDTVCKSEKKDICETSDACKSLLVSFMDILGNEDSCGTLSSASGYKCEICSEVFYSEKLLYAHQRLHFTNLAEQRGFDPKSFPIEDSTSLRHFLTENKIKCYDDLEKSFEKIVAVFSLEKLLKEPFCPITAEVTIVQQIANKEMSENIRTKTENNGFNPRHIVGKLSSTLPIPGSSSFSSASSPLFLTSPLLSSSHPSLHPPSFLPVCPKQTKSNSLLHFHRCLFCSKMFSSNANILKHLRSSMEDNEDEMSSIRSKSNQKSKEYIAWYKHIAIVLGVKLQIPNQKVVESTQHLKLRFDVEERLWMLLHRRGLYKCRQCHKEYTTFRSLFFHRGNHSKRLTPRKLTQRIHTPKKFLRKQSGISMILSPKHISLNQENDCSAIGKHEKCPKISLPLLCFSLKDHFWIKHLKGKLKAIHSDFQSLSVDKSLPLTEIESTNWLRLSDIVDSQLEKPQKSFSEKDTEALVSSNERYEKEKLELPLHLFLNNFKDYIGKDLSDDDLKQTEGAQPKLDTRSAGVSNLGVIKMFGQDVTTMVSFQLQKCVHCGKLFTDVGRFEKHLQFHAGKLPIRCQFCPKCFTNVGAFFRHKILTHFDENRKSFKNKKSEIIVGRKCLRLQKGVGSSFDEMKDELGTNLAAVNTAYVSNLANKVLGRRRMSADFSDSTVGQKSSSENSNMMSEMVDSPPGLSDRQVTRIRLKQSGEPFELEKNNLNGCILENLQSETTELAAGINIVKNEYSNEPTQVIYTTNNLETEVSPNISDEDCIYVSSSSEPVYKNDMNVKRNGDVFGKNWSRQENDENKSTVLKPSICRAKMQFGLNPKFNKETSINSSFGNNFILSDSSNEIQESNFKEDDLADCIFINDYSPGDTSVFDAGSSTRQYLSDHNEKTNLTNEIIILSDEENNDDSAQNFSDGNTLITLCDNTETLFSRPKENQFESRPKVDSKLSQGFYESLGTCLQNNETNYVNKPDMQNPNKLQSVQAILATSSPPQISSMAVANSSMTVDSEKASCWSKSRSSFKEYRCLYCTKTCSSSSNLKEHMRRHTGERPFSCDVCHKTFAQKSTLSKHTQIHSRFKMLSSSENITIHKSNSSYGIRPTEQIPVRSPFDSADSLDEQSKSKQVSNVDTNPKSSILTAITEWETHVINSDLSNTLNNREDLKPMINIENDHLDVTRLSETIPTSLSSPYYTLSTHKSTADWDMHTIEADVSSNLINQKCNDLKPIIDIENDHTDVTQSSLSSLYYATSTSNNDPFPQNSADFSPCKTVLTKSNSTQPHASNVVPKNCTFNKPYSCDVCDRMFSTVGNLKEHRRTHTGERPFECPFCEKTFAQASTRSRHVKNHSIRFAN